MEELVLPLAEEESTGCAIIVVQDNLVLVLEDKMLDSAVEVGLEQNLKQRGEDFYETRLGDSDQVVRG